MSAPTPAGPAITVHAQGFAARKLTDSQAEVVLRNPIVNASAILTRDELRSVADSLHALAADMTEAPAALATPAGVGKLHVPGRD